VREKERERERVSFGGITPCGLKKNGIQLENIMLNEKINQVQKNKGHMFILSYLNGISPLTVTRLYVKA
jgi:hypothetical protein